MKKFISKLLYALLIVLLCMVAAVASYVVVNYRGWPWWAGACVFGGLIGFVISFMYLRKWLLRRREKRFVKRIVEQDDSAIAAAPEHERSRLQELQARWMEAVSLLRNSELRKQGNPLYVLPWYMIFGESDSGKSTAIASSRLTTILTDVGPVPGVSATRNCDWWFFEEAIILDTAGRYAIPLDEVQDREEWERFLTLLLKFRKKEPLNGLIVTLPADRLLSGDEDSLARYGRSLRRRIDELMRVLGVRFPVYVLITKVDLVFGFKGLAEVLPDSVHSQAMGLVNETLVTDPEEFVDNTIRSVTERLRELRLLMLDSQSRFDPAFLIFSDELERLRPRIKAFAIGAFEHNPYQELPLFRGMFFSSGEQTGELNSEFLSGLSSLEGVEKKLPGTRKGLFLHDFFSKVLPRDRNLFTPILEFLKWKLLSRNLGMTVWLSALFIVCGMFSLSYMFNQRAMDELFTAFPKKPVYSKMVDEQVVEMESFREKIQKLKELNSNWLIPRLGLNVSNVAQRKVEDIYCDDFKSVLLEPMDEQLNAAIGKMGTNSPEQLTSDFVTLLAWRIDMLENRLGGAGGVPDVALQHPSGRALAEAVKGFDPDLIKYFSSLYDAYLKWTDDSEALYEQKLLLQASLGKIFALKGRDFKWLVDWVNSNPEVQPVTLSTFWGGPDLHFENEMTIEPAYTQDGLKILHSFISEIKSAMQETGEFDQREKAFWSWYAQQYYKDWFNFAQHFMEGERQLLTKNDYRDMATRMSLPDNPYFKLLSQMKDEFRPLKDIGPPPNWVNQLFYFNIVLSQYEVLKAKGVEGASEKAQDSLRKIVSELGGKMATDIETRIDVAKKLDTYMKMLGDIAAFTNTQETAYKSAAALYPGAGGGSAEATASSSAGASSKSGPGVIKKSPVEVASQAMASIKVQMDSEGQGSHVFWSIVGGPLDFIVYVITMEASCELQQLWEGKVLAETAHIPANKLRENLFGKSGVVNKFTAAEAKPFLNRSTKGWSSRSWFGIPFPFRDEFFTFLDDGARGSQEIQPEYKVTLSTLPTAVNSNATEEPIATELAVECGSARQELINYNYAEDMAFTWKPDDCGTTTLTIRFPGLDLTRSYEGQLGFAKFLGEFRNGVKTFTPDDFPDQKKGLVGLGVSSIRVGYKIQGAVPIIGLLDIKPLNVPDIITDCWEH